MTTPAPYVAFYKEFACTDELTKVENPKSGCHRIDPTPPPSEPQGVKSVYHTLPNDITVWDSPQGCYGHNQTVPPKECTNLKFLSFYYSYLT